MYKIESKKKISFYFLIVFLMLFFFSFALLFFMVFFLNQNNFRTKEYPIFIFGIVFLFIGIYSTFKLLKKARKIIIHIDHIIISGIKYRWSDFKRIKLSGKQRFMFHYYETTSLFFNNKDCVFFIDDFYSNSSEMKCFINEKILKNINLNSVGNKKHNISTEVFKTFKGNPILSFRGLMLWSLTLAFLYGIIKINDLKKATLLIVFLIGWLTLNAWMMHYFEVSKNYLIIKNHYYFWKKKVYKIEDLEEVIFEQFTNQSNRIKIITKIFNNNFYLAGSLTDETWLELKKELENKKIKVRNECI
jgi:hypothetical protein